MLSNCSSDCENVVEAETFLNCKHFDFYNCLGFFDCICVLAYRFSGLNNFQDLKLGFDRNASN